MQCKEFLDDHRQIKAVESEDTALSAKEIAEEGAESKGKAAICSELAAQIYGLDILAKSIETNKTQLYAIPICGGPLESG